MRRLVVAAAGLAMAAALSVVPAQAQGGLGLTPTVLDFGDLGAGGTAVASLTIESGSESPIVLDVSVTGAQSSWFSVHATLDQALDGVAPVGQLELAAGEQSVVHVRLSVPLTFEDRLALEAGLQLVEVPAEGQDVGLGVEVPMRAQVGGELRVEGEVVSVEVPITDPGEPVEVRARVRNNGNSLLVVEADGSLEDGDGLLVSESTTRALIRVGQEQLMTLSIAGPVEPGAYRLRAAFTAAGSEIETLDRELAIGQEIPAPDGPEDRGSEGRGPVVWGAVIIGLAALTGAVLVARHEVGEPSGRPKRAREPEHAGRARRPKRAKPPKEGIGRHSAASDDEAWGPTS